MYGGGIRHSGVEGFFLLPFREKRSVFEKTRVKRKGGGTLYIKEPRNRASNIHRIYL